MSDIGAVLDRAVVYLVFATPALFGIAALIYGRVTLARLRATKAREAKAAHSSVPTDVLVSKNDVLTAINAINRRDVPHAAE